MTFKRVNLDLEAADEHLNHCHREIKEIHCDINLMCASFADALSQIEYLKEMDIEREGRINQLEEGNARMERRMRELEEILVMMQSCHC